jgi:hypothetical protein
MENNIPISRLYETIKTKKGVIPNDKREDEGVLKRSLERNFS